MNRDREDKLVDGLRGGRESAWEEFFDVFAKRIWRSVARLLGSDSSAVADVVQETFLTAATSVDRFDPARGSLGPWLWGIARNQAGRHLRGRSREAGLERAVRWWLARSATAAEWLDAGTCVPSEALEAEELAALVRRALAGLRVDQEEALTKRYLDGQSVKEIAAGCEDTEVAVRSRLARARRAFRQQFLRIVGPDSEYRKDLCR